MGVPRPRRDGRMMVQQHRPRLGLFPRHLLEDHGVFLGRHLGPLGVRKLENASAMEQEVDLLVAVTPKMKVPAAPPVHLEPAQFAEDKRLPQCARHRRFPKIGERSAAVEPLMPTSQARPARLKFYDPIAEFAR